MNHVSHIDPPGRKGAGSAGRRGVSLLLLVLVPLGVGLGALFLARRSPIPVRRHAVTRVSLGLEIFGTGSLEAERSATLAPERTGRIRTVWFDEGQATEAGRMVAELDPDEADARLRMAEAEVAVAEAVRMRLAAELEQAQAAESLAFDEADRARQLHRRKALTDADRDRRANELVQARAGTLRARAATTEADARIGSARTALDHALVERDRLRLRSPIAGVVTRRFRDPGDTAGPGSPVLTVVDPTSLRVEAWVDEASLDRLRPGQPVKVSLRSRGASPVPGRVSAIAREVDRETRELLVHVALDEVVEGWAVGQRADVLVEVDRRSLLAVPADMVTWQGGVARIAVEEAGTIRYREIELGDRGNGLVEAAAGLAEGEITLGPVPGGPELVEAGRVIPP